jgi:hypothetical protein
MTEQEQQPSRSKSQPLKTYRGYSDREDAMGPVAVTVQTGRRRPRPLRHRVYHSPEGFSWGYSGSGPAELARAILADHFRGRIPHQAIYQQFKQEMIAGLEQGRPWTITSTEIEAWLMVKGWRESELFHACWWCSLDTRRSVPTWERCKCGRRHG